MQPAVITIPTASCATEASDLQRAESRGCSPEKHSQDGSSSSRSIREDLRKDEGPWKEDSLTPAEKLDSARTACEQLIKSHEVSRAMTELIRCVALSRLVYGDGHWRLAEAFANVAYGYLKLRGLPAQAQQHAETARDILLAGTLLPELVEKKDILPTLMTTYYTLGVAHLMQKNLNEAHQNLQKAEKIYQGHQGLCRSEYRAQNVSREDLQRALGRVALQQKRPASAVLYFEKAASCVSSTRGQDSLDLVGIYQEMARAEQMRARHEEAIEHLLQAHSIATAQLDESVETAQAALLLAQGYAAAGSLRSSELTEQYFKESINMFRSVLGEENPLTFPAVDNYTSWLIQTGRQQQALELLRSTLQRRVEAFGNYSDSMADTLSLMSSITLAGGEMKKAYKLLKKCLEIQTVLYGSQHKKSRQTQQLLDMLNKSPAVCKNSLQPQ
nr:PREDICTED: tetratricopeptide repeat protein 23-like isoform X1 [Lepisosteus oculatus]XP_015195934.1 PREDICTED: tetratricopeptide repeat protein 23-like isoform X1 [Lepisosteus oculatus]